MQSTLQKVVKNFQALAEDTTCQQSIETCVAWVLASLRSGGKALICGNGGSAADAQHIAGEFLCRFYHDRQPLAAIALTTDSSTITAIGNDYAFDQIFSRQVDALGCPGDVLLGISTSGSSRNVVKAFEVAGRKNIKRILLTGSVERDIAGVSDLVIKVPSVDTPRVQEMLLVVEHLMCEKIEKAMVESQ